MKKIIAIVLTLIMAMSVFGAYTFAQEEIITAAYTNSTVLIDGTPVEFEAYNINDNNYFKLRDIAMAFKGKNIEFSVGWNEYDECIEVDRDKDYTPVGGELLKGDGTDKHAKASSAKVLEPMGGGFWPQFTIYNINDNNYFKLRDLGAVLGFNVDWDEANNCIIIDTEDEYM